mmetsp:Transcript_2761/g.4173  ORF Transcript_2761/g.4173 Transcript_2761/m.4173 type:complete len:93 (+) Transcript_2761:1616-1894(+)
MSDHDHSNKCTKAEVDPNASGVSERLVVIKGCEEASEYTACISEKTASVYAFPIASKSDVAVAHTSARSKNTIDIAGMGEITNRETTCSKYL